MGRSDRKVLDGSRTPHTMRPMPKELQAEIQDCIEKHAAALARDLAELFRTTTMKRVARMLGEAEEIAPAPRREKPAPKRRSSKKRTPGVARAKKRAPGVARAASKKKSRAETGEDIVEFIRKHPGCGAADVMKGLGIPQPTWMGSKLLVQKAGRIRMTGKPRDARYFVTDTIVRRPAA